MAEVADHLDEIREQDVRQASYCLHPSFIREGLPPALHALIERFEGEVDVTLAIDPAFRRPRCLTLGPRRARPDYYRRRAGPRQ